MKTGSENTDPFKMLENIQQVDAPEFLFSRIKGKITAIPNAEFSPAHTWAIAASFSVLLAVNFFFIQSGNPGITDLAQSMDLLPDNSIYK